LSLCDQLPVDPTLSYCRQWSFSCNHNTYCRYFWLLSNYVSFSISFIVKISASRGTFY